MAIDVMIKRQPSASNNGKFKSPSTMPTGIEFAKVKDIPKIQKSGFRIIVILVVMVIISNWPECNKRRKEK